MDIRPDRVAAYVRWSTDDQAGGTTLEVQRDACAHYVQSQSWQWREDLCFIDDGFSGGDLRRPGMERLRDLVQAGRVDCVVVYRIDRLTRNIVDAVDLVLREWVGRCHLKSVLEPVDTTNDMGRMIFNILAMFADFERATIRHRLHTAKTKLIAEGKQLHGRPAFGYAPDPQAKGRWIEDQSEAPLVRDIFERLAGGASAYRVVQELNRAGLRTRRGTAWSLPSLLWLARNPVYAGRIVYGVTSVVSADRVRPDQRVRCVENRRANKVRVRNAHATYEGRTAAAPPLVDEATWQAVQASLDAHRMRRREVGSRAAGSPHLLVGLGACGACGAPLVHRSAGRSHGYYVCSRHHAGTCPDSGYVPARDADAIVAGAFLRLFGIGELRAEDLAPGRAVAQSRRHAVQASLASARREAQRAEEADRRLVEAALAGTVPFDQLADLRAAGRRLRDEAAARVRALAGELGRFRSQERERAPAAPSLDAAAAWSSLPTWRRRQALQAAIEGRIRLFRPRRGTGGQGEISVQVCWALS